MPLSFRYNQEKNQLLKSSRGINFDDVIMLLKKDMFIVDIEHPNRNYHHQRMYVIAYKGYAYAVPYVINAAKNEIFLKTIYPSRKLTRQYIKKEKR